MKRGMTTAKRTGWSFVAGVRLSAWQFVSGGRDCLSGGEMILKDDLVAVWGGFCENWRETAGKAWLVLGGFWLVTGLVVFRFDEPLLAWLQGGGHGAQEEGWLKLAKGLKEYADFHYFNLGLAVVMILGGLFAKNVYWRRTGLIFLLAGAMAGVTVQTAKTLIGRPRPSQVLKDEEAKSSWQLRGPTVKGGWRAYPSGHSTAVWASCIALGLRWRKGMVLCVGFGILVAWSRMYMNSHWPTDVLHGAGLGTIIGWFWGRMK